jgi:serine/threonine protein kinase
MKYHQSILDDGSEKTLPKHSSFFNGPRGILNRDKLKRLHAESQVGTYYYMAPEVLRGEKYNATADWYCFYLIDLRKGGLLE